MGIGGRVRERLALELQFCAQHLGAVHFGVRGALGHHDHRPDAEAGRVIGDSLRMVAGAHRNDAPCPFLGREQQQLVQRAPLLERSGELVVLELEEDFGPGQAGQGAAMEEGRPDDGACDAAGGVPDVLERRHGRRLAVAAGVHMLYKLTVVACPTGFLTSSRYWSLPCLNSYLVPIS